MRAEFNEHDGLMHKKDGSLQDPANGATINGANHGIAYIQKNTTTAVKTEHHHHKKHHHKKHHKHHHKHHQGHKKENEENGAEVATAAAEE